MKKFLIISTLSILFQSSMTICSEKNDPNKAYKTAGIAMLAGLGLYGIYRYTRQETPQSSSNHLHEHTQKENRKTDELLINQQPSNPEKPAEDNNSKKESKSEKPQINDNKTVLLKPNTEKKPLESNPKLPQQTTKAPIITTEKHMSFLDALHARLKEDDIKKLLTDALLTDHAFSN